MSKYRRRPPRPTYVVHLRPEPGVDGIRALRAGLKFLLRRHRLRCLSARERGVPMKQLKPLAAPDGISGLQVMMPGTCSKCRHRMAVIGHAAALTCARCRLHRGRLSKQEVDFINKIISTFGRLTAPVVLRTPPTSGAIRCQPGHRSSSSAPGRTSQ